jgi:hypothetical protein
MSYYEDLEMRRFGAPIRSYDEAVKRYEDTVPIGGNSPVKDRDVRPLGTDRRYTFNRIVKSRDGKGAFVACFWGWHNADPVASGVYWEYDSATYKSTRVVEPVPCDPAFIREHAPLVFWKRAGYEYVKLAPPKVYSVSDYRALDWVVWGLPGVTHHRNARYGYHLRSGGQVYRLVPRLWADTPAWSHADKVWKNTDRPTNAITMRRKIGTGMYEVCDYPKEARFFDVPRIQRKKKASLQPKINEFRDWLFAIGPTWPQNDIRGIIQSLGSGSYVSEIYTDDQLQQAVLHPDDSMVLTGARLWKKLTDPIAGRYDHQRRIWTPEPVDKQLMTARFNRAVNHALQLYETVTLPVED